MDEPAFNVNQPAGAMDMRTVLASYLITSVVCAAVMASLWYRNRQQFNGIGFWLTGYVMMLGGLTLIALREYAPDFASIVAGNALTIGGTLLLYMGSERFLGKRGSQLHNYVLLAAFVFVHAWFAFVHPSLAARTINLAAALVLLCGQCAWLMFRRADAELRPITRGAGFVFAAYVGFNLLRIYFEIAVPSASEDFFASDVYDVWSLLAYQTLFVGLTFSLFLTVNRRLLMNLQKDVAARLQTEDALRLNEEKFQKAFYSNPSPAVISRLSDGRLVEVNDGFCRISGYARDEALNSSITTLQLWARPQDRETFIQTLLKEKSVRNAAYDFRAKSGNLINGEISAELIQLGGEAHIVSVIQDVTTQKKLEASLVASREMYQDLAERQVVGVYRIRVQKYQSWEKPEEPHYEYLFINDEYCRLTGVSREEHFADPSLTLKLIHPEDYPAFAQKNEEVDVSLEPFLWEGRMIIRGETRWMHYESCPRNFPDVGVVWTGVLMDVTERKQAEQILRASEEKFRQLITSAPDAVLGTDRQGKITFANTEAITMLGYAPNELVGLDVEKLVPLNLRALHALQRETYMENPRARLMSSRTDLKAVRKDGSEIPVDIKLSPVEMSDGVQIVIFMRDVTEQKLTEERLRQQAKLLAKLEERQQLARDLHDSVNQSIYSVILFADTLESLLRNKKFKKALEVTGRVRQSGQLALRDVRLLLYKSQAAPIDAEMDLLAALEERLNMVERRVGVQAQIIHADDALFRCPPQWRENLYWIVIEALNNALKHADARRVTIDVRCVDGNLELSVEDDGAGFDAAQVQAGGFGMKSMRERANLLGGILSVASEPKNGTRVQFTAKMESPE